MSEDLQEKKHRLSLISPAQRHRVMQLWYAGEKTAYIADKVGIDVTSVSRIVREYEELHS